LQRMKNLVAHWCSAHQLPATQVRLDAISVLITNGRVHIEHLKRVH
jgi:Holliday junction resolvase-like predicted endonuclease